MILGLPVGTVLVFALIGLTVVLFVTEAKATASEADLLAAIEAARSAVPDL